MSSQVHLTSYWISLTSSHMRRARLRAACRHGGIVRPPGRLTATEDGFQRRRARHERGTCGPSHLPARRRRPRVRGHPAAPPAAGRLPGGRIRPGRLRPAQPRLRPDPGRPGRRGAAVRHRSQARSEGPRPPRGGRHRRHRPGAADDPERGPRRPPAPGRPVGRHLHPRRRGGAVSLADRIYGAQ